MSDGAHRARRTLRPLWQERALLIVLLPVLLLIALGLALKDGWREFWWELNRSAVDIRKIWRGERT